MILTLTRFYTPVGTFGRLQCLAFQYFTCERLWINNAPDQSCIPEGSYPLDLAASVKIAQITQGHYTQTWHVLHVPDRTNILIHPGNVPSDSDGCLLLGSALGFIMDKWAITNSQPAFDRFMTMMPPKESHTLTIVRYQP